MLRLLRPRAGWGCRWNSSMISFTDVHRKTETLGNVVQPAVEETGGVKWKPNEVVTRYILTCVFGKNNTHFTYSAVMEDLNFMKRHSGISYNEAYLYYLKLPQKVKFNISTGCLGFRKSARGEYEAAFQTATKVFEMIQEKRLMDKDIEIVMKDFGKGRAAFIAALNGKEGNNVRRKFVRISDKTPLKFGGVRSPRVRRL